MELLRVRGKVVSVRKQLIPRLYVTVLEGEDGTRVEFDTHEDLVVYREGELLEATVSRETPEYREGEDYVVRATFASERSEEGVHSYLFSAGGLLFIFRTKSPLKIEPTEKVYIKISRLG